MTPKPISSGPLAAAIFLTLACVPSRGGWDLDALLADEPSIAVIEGHRLGDLLPFPALDGDRIVLVACRFAPGQPVRVGGGGPQWPASWGRAAVRALNRSVAGVELVLEDAGGSVARTAPSIEIVTVQAIGGTGPRGLGDTLSECDVSPMVSATAAARPAYRGLLTGAEIRMRRAQLDITAQVRDASAEEWVGALMHELAHALGFVGHAAAGHSILVRDETRIREAGRLALIGQAVPDPTLEAFYRLRPGQRLGTRSVKADDVSWLHAIRKLDRERSAGDRRSMRTFSSVGDREARIVWRYSDGSQLGVRLPYWRSELRSGAAITLRPDRTTRRLLMVETVDLD